jgi:hypothetical protein
MTWLFETPTYILSFGGLATACCLGGWIQLRHRVLAYLTGLCILMTGCLLAVEHYVITPLEEVEITLRQIARDLESNRLDRLLQHIHSKAPDIRQLAENEFSNYRFERVSIRGKIEIQVDTSTKPYQAETKFNVVAVGRLSRSGAETMRVPRLVTVTFLKEGDQWKAVGYEHRSPFGNIYQNRYR